MNEYHTPSQVAHGSRKPTGLAMSPLFSKGMGGSSAVAARPTSKKKSLEVAKTTSKKDHAFSSMRSLDHCTTTDNNLPGRPTVLYFYNKNTIIIASYLMTIAKQF